MSLVDVNEIGAGSVGNRRDSATLAVNQRQGRAKPQVTNVELRDTRAIIGLVIKLRTAVDGQLFEHLNRLRGTYQLDVGLVDRFVCGHGQSVAHSASAMAQPGGHVPSATLR